MERGNGSDSVFIFLKSFFYKWLQRAAPGPRSMDVQVVGKVPLESGCLEGQGAPQDWELFLTTLPCVGRGTL